MNQNKKEKLTRKEQYFAAKKLYHTLKAYNFTGYPDMQEAQMLAWKLYEALYEAPVETQKVICNISYNKPETDMVDFDWLTKSNERSNYDDFIDPDNASKSLFQQN